MKKGLILTINALMILTQYLYKLLTLFKNTNSADQLKWAPQARGPLCFAHAAQSISTPLYPLLWISSFFETILYYATDCQTDQPCALDIGPTQYAKSPVDGMPHNATKTGVTDVRPPSASFWDLLFRQSLRKLDWYDDFDRTPTNYRMTEHVV